MAASGTAASRRVTAASGPPRTGENAMRRACLLFVTLLGLPLAAGLLPAGASSEPGWGEHPEPVHTFSIVAHDPERKEWGVGVASRVLAVGSVVPSARANVGAVATQASTNASYGPKGLELL